MRASKSMRFSIVIPCYNEAAYIAEALTSLQKQDFSKNYEIIVVDNNSTDDTAAIASNFGVRVIREKQPGVCAARQTGTKAAKGQIVISTDADTIFKKDWLARIDRTFLKHPNAVAVAGPCRYVGGPLWGRLYPYFLFGAVRLSYLVFKAPFYVTATNIAFKKNAWNGYNTSIAQGGDELELLHSLKAQGTVIFKNNNSSYTSPRRLTRGLFYNVFVTFFIYYLGAYYLTKLLKRPVLGTAPAYRENHNRNMVLHYGLVCAVAVLVIALFPTIRMHMHHMAYSMTDASVGFSKELLR